jgi:peroxiredoxin
MKNHIQFTSFLLIILMAALPIVAFSQTPAKGYEIIVKPQNVNDSYLYMVGIYGNKAWIADSAKFSKNGYIFKNPKQELPSGFYTIQNKNGDLLADFIVDQTRKFGVTIAENFVSFTNSDENVIYQNFKKDLDTGNDLSIYNYTAPESLLGKFVLAQFIPVSIPEFFWGSHDGRDAAAQRYYQYLIDHYYDNVDFKDVRLMYTPLDIDLKDFFVESLFPQTANNVIANVENLFHRILEDSHSPISLDVRDFYLKKLIHLYLTAEPKFDEVFIYLIDNYVSKLTSSEFISDSEQGVFKRIADRKRKTLVGETIPVFQSFTKEHHKISTDDFTHDYVLLWFWDPDCEHCVEYTPQLYDFYCKYHELYKFDVIACSVTEDYDRWAAFINEHHLEWINTSYAISAPNYDAVEYFNFADTPAIFIIDKNHTIVARQFALDELFEIFESLQH